MKYFFTATIIFFCCPTIFGQNILKGKVTDQATGKALEAVSVFIANSSTGTTTNAEGNFALSGFTTKQFDVVASCIGYETVTTNISGEILNNFINIKLKERSAELENVILQSYEKDGWNKWGKAIMDNLIGMGESAKDCSIKNKEVIRFVFNKEQNLLTAYAFEPLIIENKYLGYNLVYDMQSFVCDYKHNYIFFMGFPFFKNMEGNERKKEKWSRHRQYAYEGSIMHFMRSLYKNTLLQEGFTINVLQRYLNKEKQRVKKIYKDMHGQTNRNYNSNTDSSLYYNNILKQSDSLDYVHPQTLSADSVSYAFDSTTAVLNFKGFLQITYAKKKEVPVNDLFHPSTKSIIPKSIIRFVNQPEVYIFSDGSYFETSNIMVEQYWNFSEKLSNLLPINFKPLLH